MWICTLWPVVIVCCQKINYWHFYLEVICWFAKKAGAWFVWDFCVSLKCSECAFGSYLTLFEVKNIVFIIMIVLIGGSLIKDLTYLWEAFLSLLSDNVQPIPYFLFIWCIQIRKLYWPRLTIVGSNPARYYHSLLFVFARICIYFSVWLGGFIEVWVTLRVRSIELIHKFFLLTLR